MTFSIAAWDPSSRPEEWGVAVASKFLAVGAAVPWARAGAGAVATQALANLAYGPEGLAHLGTGMSAADVVQRLTGADDEREHRQLGVVDARGRAATFTGSECFDWAGGRTGDGYCCQGNILTGPDVVDRMAEAFESTKGELTVRLLAALRAGDEAGGDRRGRQSAAVLVVREGGGYGGGIDTVVDLRVEDHAAPVTELDRLWGLHRLYFPRPEDMEFVPVDQELAAEIRGLLRHRGYEVGVSGGYDEGLRDALFEYIGTENLEERWNEDPTVERGILEHLRSA
ncbi:MAG TPA: DUF1028 domain-containing protein [Actinomycetota bacterium]|nr:DUF1028 domain-containing protein [Actinomycetota bacterium]